MTIHVHIRTYQGTRLNVKKKERKSISVFAHTCTIYESVLYYLILSCKYLLLNLRWNEILSLKVLMRIAKLLRS